MREGSRVIISAKCPMKEFVGKTGTIIAVDFKDASIMRVKFDNMVVYAEEELPIMGLWFRAEFLDLIDNMEYHGGNNS